MAEIPSKKKKCCEVVMVECPKGRRGRQGPRGPRGLPGRGVVPCCPLPAAGPITAGNPVRLIYNGTNGAQVRQVLPDPSFNWAVQSLITNPNDVISSTGIATDCKGNIYVTGAFAGTVNLPGGYSLISPVSGFSPFVIKLNYIGQITTTFVPTSTNSASNGRSAAISIGCNGSVSITGSFTGNFGFDNYSILSNATSISANDTFVVQFDDNLNPRWASYTNASSTSQQSISGTSIATDCLGNVYITGNMTASGHTPELITLVPPSAYNLIPSTSTGLDVFIAKLDGIGNWIWTNSTTTDVTNPGMAFSLIITQDCNGNIFITGNFTANITFSTITLSTTSIHDVFIAQVNDSTGQWIYAVQTVSGTDNSFSSASDITTDCRGNVYIIGFYFGTIVFGTTTLSSLGGHTFISQLNTNLIWKKTITTTSSNGSDSSLGITTDGQDNVYVIGYFEATVNFGDQSLTSTNGYHYYVAKLTTNLNWVNVIQATGMYSPTITTGIITTNYQGDIYACGNFDGSAIFGTTTLISNNSDMWISNIVSDRSIQMLGIAPVSVNKGGNIVPIFNGFPSGNIYSQLIPAFDYYINTQGNIVSACRCSFCSDPSLRYLGTACSSTQLLIRN